MASKDVQSAVAYINTTLVSKGYIKDSERLEFAGDAEGRTDTRTINVLYALLNSLDSDVKQRETDARTIQELQKTAERETSARVRLEAKYEVAEKQSQTRYRASAALELELKTERSQNAELRDAVIRAKHAVQQMKAQFATELRKRDVENGKLKDRIRDPRSRSSTVLTGVSGTLSKSHNSYSIPSSTDSSPAERSATVAAIDKHLRAANTQLTRENKQLLNVLHEIRTAAGRLTDEQVQSKLPGFTVKQPESAGAATRRDGQDVGSEILQAIDEIRNLLNSPSFVSVSELREKELEVDNLKARLKEATENWERAIKTMEKWKSYRETRDRPGPSSPLARKRRDPKLSPSVLRTAS